MFEDPWVRRISDVAELPSLAPLGMSLRSQDEARRATLHESNLALVEDAYVPSKGPYPSGFESRFQLGLTYLGAFSYQVGSRKWLIDANSSLFISPGWEASEEHPLPGRGHAALILTPSPALLEEIAGEPSRSAAFLEGSVPSSMRLRVLVQQILHSADAANPLRKDEWTLAAIHEALRTAPRRQKHHGSRLVDRAKEYLHAHFGERLLLDEVSRAVGVTPTYLTQEFTKREGVPLYRYQLQLRLSQALLELPRCDDITGLALDLGFSSHSHFTLAFRKAFGLTPSQYRSTTKRKPATQ